MQFWPLFAAEQMPARRCSLVRPKPKVASEVDAPVALSLIFLNAEEWAMDELRLFARNILFPLREYKWTRRTMNRRKVWLHIHTHTQQRRWRRVVSSTIAATAPAWRPGKTDVPDPKKRDRGVGASGGGREANSLLSRLRLSLPQLIFDMNSMGGWWLVSLPALICSLTNKQLSI